MVQNSLANEVRLNNEAKRTKISLGKYQKRKAFSKQRSRNKSASPNSLGNLTSIVEMSSSVLFLSSLSSSSASLFLTKQLHPTKGRAAAVVRCSNGPALSGSHEQEREGMALLRRRDALASAAACGVSVLGFAGDGLAVVKQGLLAGRIPGLSKPDENGWRTYRRPDEKSGGHGVGWSPIIPYSFKVPDGWEEAPVSIADLGGTEIDLRFGNPKEGRLSVIVAPTLRFADNLDDATIEKIGSPEKVINAFGPEVIGENVEGKVLATATAEYSGRTYYQFELEPPHIFITATAAGNRLYLFSVTANGLQWKRHYKDLKKIAESFRVV